MNEIHRCRNTWMYCDGNCTNCTLNSIDANLIKNGTIDDWVVVNVPEKNVSDLISRQAVIKFVKTECNPYGKPTLDFESGEKVIEYLKHMSPAQQWTPCSEALPKAGIRYQVTFESGEVGYADFHNKIFLFDGSVKENVWEIEEYYEDDGEVIAWMPLPEPYKGGEDETD